MKHLVALRYRLMWASVRSRNGKIALFLLGILVFWMFAALMSLGGFAGAVMAIRNGEAEQMAQLILSLLFFQAILVTNVSGFGMNTSFSDLELRRYPLTARQRLIARHLIAILDPFWFLYLVFYLGLAAGMTVYGGGNFFSGIAAAVLLLLCNYAAARLVELSIARLMVRKAGSEILVAVALAGAIAGALWVRGWGDGSTVDRLWMWFDYTPAFGAARAMTQGGWSGPVTICAWLCAIIAAMVWMERNPARPSGRKDVRGVVWDGLADRIGDHFPAGFGPLVAFWLRFNGRNAISRRLRWLALPVSTFIAYVTYKQEHRGNPYGLFLTALGVLPLAACLGSGRIAVNQFGYLGGGFRRLLLLPVPRTFLLWSGFTASMLLSLGMFSLVLLCWIIASPLPFDWRMIVMLVCSALTGVLLLHSASAWVSISNPSKGNYFMRIGNDLSLGGNVVFLLGPLAGVFGPNLVDATWPAVGTPESWRLLLPLPLMAAVFYWAALALAGRAFAGRVERVLAVVEGKS